MSQSEGQRLQGIRARLKLLQEKKLLSSSYTADSPIQLFPPQQVDVTDRSLVTLAPQYGFDAAGFDGSDPLRKDLFYMPPYLTCKWCNEVAFVDVVVLRSVLSAASKDAREHLPRESLPKCKGCGRTDMYHVGVKDFGEAIRKREEDARRRASIERVAANQIQHNFRLHIRRAWARAERDAVVIHRMLQNRAASYIQAMGRRRLARRRVLVERDLVEIKRSHPMLLVRVTALGHGAIFWYHNQDEVKLLYENYLELCERTGFDPPRYIVEQNIKEVARRLKVLESNYACRVQKRWRGILVRRIMKVYVAEQNRVRQIRVNAAFKIQRLYRGWNGRKLVMELLDRFKGRVLSDEFRREQKSRDIRRARAAKADRARNMYTWERREEVSARVRGQVSMAPFGGKKMVAFGKSIYASNGARSSTVDMVREGEEKRDQDLEHERGRVERKKMLQGRQAVDPLWKPYYEDEVRSLTREAIDRIAKDPSATNVNNKIRAFNSAGLKFQYPAEVYEDPMEFLNDVDVFIMAKLSASSGKKDAGEGGGGRFDNPTRRSSSNLQSLVS